MLKLDHWWDIKNDWLLWTQITYSFGWDRMNKKSKQGDIQWLRGQREVVQKCQFLSTLRLVGGGQKRAKLCPRRVVIECPQKTTMTKFERNSLKFCRNMESECWTDKIEAQSWINRHITRGGMKFSSVILNSHWQWYGDL